MAKQTKLQFLEAKIETLAANVAELQKYIEKDKDRRHGERLMAELTRNLYKSKSGEVLIGD